jgi:hypothetical protein
MRENNEEMEVGPPEFEPVRRSHKRDNHVSVGVPVLLFGIFCILLFGMFGTIALLPIGVGGLLFLKFYRQVTKLPKWLYPTLFLLFGLLFWDLISDGPIIPNKFASWLYNHSGLDAMRSEPTVLVADEDLPPAKKTDSVIKGPEKDSLPIANAPQPDNSTPVLPEKQENLTLKPANEPPPAISSSDQQAFDKFLDNGLKAVENEEYDAANQNFRNAFKASPRHPRLLQLAAEFKKTADQKCQDFKNANTRQLSHIPNNYYQYAASLTQTVPLKCE